MTAQQPSVACNACGVTLNEPTNLDPNLRQPCPNCGSLSRLMKVQIDDSLHVSDSISWERTRRRRQVHRGYFLALILFIVGPPLILALVGASLPIIPAAAIGIALNLVGAFIGYRAVWLRVEIDRG